MWRGVAYEKLNQQVSNTLCIGENRQNKGERGLLLGGSKCTISIARAIGDMEFVHCTEVVRFSEHLLLEISLYTSMRQCNAYTMHVQCEHNLKINVHILPVVYWHFLSLQTVASIVVVFDTLIELCVMWFIHS